MKTKWKVLILVGLLVLIAGGILASIKISQRGIVVVQTGKVTRQDLTSIVTASGEIKPKNYINIGANQQGPLTAIFVKEGDHVKKGQILAQIESVDAHADVRAQQASEMLPWRIRPQAKPWKSHTRTILQPHRQILTRAKRIWRKSSPIMGEQNSFLKAN